MILRERLQQMFAFIIRDHPDRVPSAHGLAVKTMLAVFYILKYGFSVRGVPADDIDKAGLVAKLAAGAFIRIKLDPVAGIDHRVFLSLRCRRGLSEPVCLKKV